MREKKHVKFKYWEFWVDSQKDAVAWATKRGIVVLLKDMISLDEIIETMVHEDKHYWLIQHGVPPKDRVQHDLLKLMEPDFF